LFSLGDVLDLVKHGGYWYPLVAPADRDWPGIVRLASNGDTVAGSDTRRAVTPAGALALLNAYGWGVDGSSASNPLLTLDANAATKSGIHATDGGTANLPATASEAGLLQVLVRSAPGSPSIAQIYLDHGNRLFSRRRDGSVWGGWREVWSGVEANSLQTGTGYQRLPSGLILQWGFTTNLSPSANVTFPIAFPSNIRCVTLGPVTSDLSIVTAANSMSLSGFTIVTNKVGTHNCYWFAIGN
ncbi:pyocin knob domain-containing protein, partial [Arenibaculum sp.]|uniref:pyocin knob domain-containing protein n=1 Tax=Arenibaculum sp. TaxID=2865862 RepID=UPI002E120D2C|nr:pyocin knob domain-containing protein [Arenibaculum sp.]